MCTVTYFPLSKQSFILTSNRDEMPARTDRQFPNTKYHRGKNIIYPKDSLAGGTWFAATDTGLVACLLNGGKEPHERNPPYRMSRGVMMLEALECIRPDEFIYNYDFSDIEPFTLLFFYLESGTVRGIELIWNGNNKEIQELPVDQAMIWASSTLYDQKMKQERQERFTKFISEKSPSSQADLMEFHGQDRDKNSPNGLVMYREYIRTVSITSAEIAPGATTIRHYNLISDKARTIKLSQEPVDL